MKRIILVSLFLSFFGFSSALALDFTPPPHNVPFEYGGDTFTWIFQHQTSSSESWVFYCKDTAGEPTIDFYFGSWSLYYYWRAGGGYGWNQNGYCRLFITYDNGLNWDNFEYGGTSNAGYWVWGVPDLFSGDNANLRSNRDIKYNGYPYPDYTNNNFQVSNLNTGDILVSATTFGGFVPSKQLHISRSPEAGGGVSDYPAGENIYCGIDSYEVCEASFSLNTQVTLDAYPNDGYAFSHWEINGVISPDTDGSIDITMSESKNVEAVFYLKADDFVFPVLAQGVTDPLLNKTNPIGNGWHGNGVGENVQGAGNGHLGQDYIMNANNGDGNAAGEPVYAVANGTIVEVMNNQNTFYGWCDNDDHGWGPVVVVRHENRDGFDTTGSIVTTSCETETNPTVIYSLYGHLSKTSIQNLQIGQSIAKGQQLGVAGAYGVDQNSWTTNHLHLEFKDEVGYTEGTWYKTPANEGVCPESTSYTCGSYLVKGVGTAYSQGNNFAPHRYEPGAFINLNKQ